MSNQNELPQNLENEEASKGKFWNVFLQLANEPVVQPPLRDLPVKVLAIEDYSTLIAPQLFDSIEENNSTVSEIWKYPLHYDRLDDLQYVTIPTLAAKLKSYAVYGSPGDLLAAQSAMFQFLIREFIRLGKLPVLVPMERVTGAPPSSGMDKANNLLAK